MAAPAAPLPTPLESTRVGLQFQYHDQYSIITQALVLAPENVHISLTNTGETVLNCTESFVTDHVF